MSGLRLARAVQALTSRPSELLDAGPRFLARALGTPIALRTRLQRSAVAAGSVASDAVSSDLKPLFAVVRALDVVIDDLCSTTDHLDTSSGQVRRAGLVRSSLTNQLLLKIATIHLGELVHLWHSVQSDRGASQVILRSLADAIAHPAPSTVVRDLADAVDAARLQIELVTGRGVLELWTAVNRELVPGRFGALASLLEWTKTRAPRALTGEPSARLRR